MLGEVQDLCSLPNIVTFADPGGKEWDGEYGRYGEEDRCIQEFGKETLEEQPTWKT
jgi:hypothetical protein